MATQDKYSPRTYGNRDNNTWKETICDANGDKCRTETYYVTVQDPGDGGPLGLSGNLAGKTTIYKKNEGFIGFLTGQSGDIIVGEIPAHGPNKGKLVPPPNVWSGTPLDNAITHFSKPDNLKRVKNQAILTTKKGMMADKDVYGVDIEPVTDDPKVAEKKSEDLLETGTATPSEGSKEFEWASGGSGPKSRTQFPGAKGTAALTYPLSLGSTQQDVLQFNMLEYVARGLTPGVGSGAGTRPRMATRDIIGSVMLPIPGGIQSTNTVKWDENAADVFKLAFGSVAKDAVAGKDVGTAVARLADQVQGNTNELKTTIATTFAELAVGAEKNTFLARATGAIMNPNMELLFSAPTLRPFEFRFRLSPRSKNEAKTVVQIIRFFQQGMSPRTDGDLLFLKSPHTFQLKYLYRGAGEHPYLNSFKECALKNLQVNYTPENNYSTYEDGVMNSYEMTMQLQELQPVLNSDYDTGEDDEFPANLNFADTRTSAESLEDLLVEQGSDRKKAQIAIEAMNELGNK